MKISILAAIVASIFLTSNAFGERSLHEAFEKLSEAYEQLYEAHEEFRERTDFEWAYIEWEFRMASSILEKNNLNISDFKVDITAQDNVFLASDQYMCKFVTFELVPAVNALECYKRQEPYERKFLY